MRRQFVWVGLLWLVTGCAGRETPLVVYEASSGREADLPPMPREFRGLWIATVANSDWPSRPGLSAAEQQAELRAILDRAVALRMNAVILQVRPACDALYPSAFDPWSEYLSGAQGRTPGYDPLAFAVAEAHQRGLELHAWFNPFRASHPSGRSARAAAHITRRRPDLVRRYGKHLWLDPAEPDVHTFVLAAIQDVVRRYDIDGVHLDDYFYPYPERSGKKTLAFPDDAAWNRYRGAGGRLERGDWRRSHVNAFVARLYSVVKAERPWVKVGISPFGIWRPGHPRGVKGLDAYAELFADARLWIQRGWVDYLVPQLYWQITAAAQSYPQLLHWWLAQNAYRRHIWPGNFASQVGGEKDWPPEEIARQIDLTRRARAGGNVLFSAKAVMQQDAGLGALLGGVVYRTAALTPPTPWLDNRPPQTPRAELAEFANGSRRLRWREGAPERARVWVVRAHGPSGWRSAILPSQQRELRFASDERLDFVAVSAVDRGGNLSRPAVIRLGGSQNSEVRGQR